jgi:hypothetical protein
MAALHMPKIRAANRTANIYDDEPDERCIMDDNPHTRASERANKICILCAISAVKYWHLSIITRSEQKPIRSAPPHPLSVNLRNFYGSFELFLQARGSTDWNENIRN